MQLESVLLIAVIGALMLGGFWLYLQSSRPPAQVAAPGPTVDPGWATAGLVTNAVVGVGTAILGAVL